MKLFFILPFALLCSCAYNFGHGHRSLPGGHKTVFVKMFTNQSKEVGAEAAFTQALSRELQRSGFVSVTSIDRAEVVLEGAILRISSSGGGQNPPSEPIFFEENNGNNPTGTLTPIEATYFQVYNLNAVISLKAVRSRDEQVIWQTTLNGARSYRGALLTKQGVRSSNVLYNQSRRKQTIKLIAKEVMQEAFDRLTENF